MSTATVTVVVRCQKCYRPVFVTAERHVDHDSGERYVAASPVWAAMGVHLRSALGCIAVRRP